ncbi:MAG: hypothetical protein FJZ00_13025 [Candidatus Sericytochromatia bacterium]|uniref:Uncharacterized protein n=1 Tax=Candidatus Tanganyikabacteria bacterium TaxID=2961651 RepID=A0A937X5A0_9BACT|nr:hypothetical protein [Candidatus Tanganyikabacteria bacterium]
MDWNARDSALERLGRLGKSGALSLLNHKAALDELQRRSGVVAQVAADTLGLAFRGPRSDDDADIFTVDCQSTGNILTAAEASSEGLGSVDNLSVFRHGRGFILDYYVEIRRVLHNAASPFASACGFRLYAVDDNRTVFQVTTDAVTQQAAFTVSCWPSKLVPANGLSPTTTGASRGSGGYLLATKL